MKKRMLLMLAIVAVVLTAVGFVKYTQIQKAIAEHSGFAPPPEAVTTVEASTAEWPVTLSSIGTVSSVQGVVVSADLPGIVASIDFQSGARVKAGDLLARLDTRQESAQLAAAEAQDHLADVNRDRLKKLLEQDAVAQQEFDQADAEAKQAEARVTEIRATIDRKTIRAPFSGVLGIRQISLGQYVTAGQAVVPLQSLAPVYVDFSVPQQNLRDIHVGAEIDVTLEGSPGVAGKGKISAINSVIDQGTRNVGVQATFANAGEKLRPGMFVEASIAVGQNRRVVAIPASSISHAPYGDFIFVVENVTGPAGKTYRGVRQQPVKLGDARGDQVAVTEGLKAGEEVVTSGVFKLRNGAAVLVNNAVRPANSRNPKPENS